MDNLFQHPWNFKLFISLLFPVFPHWLFLENLIQSFFLPETRDNGRFRKALGKLRRERFMVI